MNTKTLIYLIIPVLLFGSAISAQTATAFASGDAINQTILNAAMQQVNCKTNFTVSFLNQVVSVVPNASSTLTPFITGIQYDTSQLQLYANSGNGPAFRSYLTNTYDPELRTIRTSWVSSLKNVNVTKGTIKTLRSDYNASKATYESCAFGALKIFANEKVAAYQSDMLQYRQTIVKLDSNGINTQSLNQTLSGVATTVITPLQNAISLASNESQLRAAINSYCIFDGCPSGLNYHLAAKFDLGVLTGIAGKVSSMNLTTSQRANLTTAQGDLSVSSSTLQTAGTSRYIGNQSTEVWSNLKGAGSLLRQILGRK